MDRMRSRYIIAGICLTLLSLAPSAISGDKLPASKQVGSVDMENRSLDYGTKYVCDIEVISTKREAALSRLRTQPLVPLQDTFTLHSKPGATKRIYLDFTGHDGFEGDYPPYNVEGDDSSFTDNELTNIQLIWQSVAEDFMPFDVDVTTEDPGTEALKNTGGGDTEWGTRCVIGGTVWSYSWAYVGYFTSNQDYEAYVAYGGGNPSDVLWIADSASHEVGHTLGLSHDGDTNASGTCAEYYCGHGSGATAWSPIMGWAFDYGLSQWSKGEYEGANQFQDDLNIITTQNGFGYTTDDHGSNTSSATAINLNNQFPADGVIERNTDVDYFSFTMATGGSIHLLIEGDDLASNLDILARIHNSVGAVLHTSNPLLGINAEFEVFLGAGNYYLSIQGTGQNNPNGPPDDGYTDYASLGSYTIESQNTAPNNPPSFNADPFTAADAAEMAPYSDSIAGSATDPDSDPLTYSIVSGPAWLTTTTGGALSGTPGSNDLGLNSFDVQVDDGRGGTDIATLQINVVVDSDPPNPDPLTWASAPAAFSDTIITMTATTATDASGVEYYFECVSGACNDSGWQSSSTYSDSGLTPETTYSYRVRARDTSAGQNATVWSTTESATTSAIVIDPENIVLPANGGTLESFTSEYGSGYLASDLTNQVTDEDGWASQVNPGNQEFVYSFSNGDGKIMQEAIVHGGTGEGLYFSRDVEVWASDNGGSSYSFIAGGALAQSSNSSITIDLADTVANRVKLVITSGYRSDYWELAEFVVMGIPAAPPTPTTVPDVIGLSESTAVGAINAANLSANVSYAYSDTVPAGGVMSQSPSGGSTVNEGSSVDVTVSDGPAPGDTVSITKAEWKSKNSELKVEATSSLAPSSSLTVVGFGVMSYDSGKDKFSLKVKPVVNPGSVTVQSSSGGSDTKTVKQK